MNFNGYKYLYGDDSGLASGSDDRSISFQIRTTQTAGVYLTAYGTQGCCYGWCGYYLNTSSSPTSFNFDTWGSSAGYFWVPSYLNLADGNWHNVVIFTSSGTGNCEMYIDGQYSINYQSSFYTILGGSSALIIGQNPPGAGGSFFVGDLQEVGFWTGPLSSSDAYYLSMGWYTPANVTSNLQYYYPLTGDYNDHQNTNDLTLVDTTPTPSTNFSRYGTAIVSGWNYYPSVVNDNGTYKLYYTNWDGATKTINYAYGSPPATWGGYQSLFNGYAPCVIKSAANYFEMWYCNNAETGINYANSMDGIYWADYGVVFSPDAPISGTYDGTTSNAVVSAGQIGATGPYGSYYGFNMAYYDKNSTDFTSMVQAAAINSGYIFKIYSGSTLVYSGVTTGSQPWGFPWRGADTYLLTDPITGPTDISGYTNLTVTIQGEKQLGFPSVVCDGTTYHMWYGTLSGDTWKIAYASGGPTSFTKNGVVLTGGDWSTNGVNDPSVFFSSGLWHMWYQGWTGDSSGPNSGDMRIGYANSTNGSTWVKQDYYKLPSAPSSETYVWSPSVLNERELKMWYTGWDGTQRNTNYAVGSQYASFNGTSSTASTVTGPSGVNSISLWCRIGYTQGPILFQGNSPFDSNQWNWGFWTSYGTHYCGPCPSWQYSYTNWYGTDWNHIVLVRDDGSGYSRIYINGYNTWAGSPNAGSGDPYALDLYVGLSSGWYTQYDIDEIILFSSGLQQINVDQLYNNGAGLYGSGTLGNILAGYHCDGNLLDYSGNNYFFAETDITYPAS